MGVVDLAVARLRVLHLTVLPLTIPTSHVAHELELHGLPPLQRGVFHDRRVSGGASLARRRSCLNSDNWASLATRESNDGAPLMSSVPETMTAIEITTPGGPDVLKPARVPTPRPGSGQILVKVAAAGVN